MCVAEAPMIDTEVVMVSLLETLPASSPWPCRPGCDLGGCNGR